MQKLEKERNDLIAEYEAVTREWMNTGKDAPRELVKKRKMLMHKMRAQYWELDPYIRGRSVYHRHGNIVGNGLVTFDYPANGSEGEWETIGYSTCREEHLMQADSIQRELGIEGDVGKSSGGGGGGEDGEKKKKKKKSRA